MGIVSRLALTFIINASWQVALVACVGAACHRLLRRAPAKFLNWIWLVSLGLCVALPLASVRRAGDSGVFPAVVVPSAHPFTQEMPQVGAVNAPWPTQLSLGPKIAPQSPSAVDKVMRAIAQPTRSIHVTPFLGWAVLACYLFSLALHSLRLGRAWKKTVEVTRGARASALPAATAACAEECRKNLGLADIPILTSAKVSGPITLGARRAVIILPDGLLETGHDNELTPVFAHEMAHIKRRDFAVNVIVELLSLPVSFHPAIALIKRRLRETRELACDEIAAAQSASAPDYASALVALARRMSAAASPAGSGYTLGVFDANILEERVMRILNLNSRASSRLAKAALAASILLLGASCILASSFTLRVSPQEQQSADETLKPFVGTWKATLKGKPYVSVALSIAEHKLSGKVTAYRVLIDENGNAVEGSEEPSVCKVTNSKLDDGRLTLNADCPLGLAREFKIRLMNDREMNFRTVDATPPPEEADGLKLVKAEDGANESAASPFLGTWKSNLKGKPAMKVEVRFADGKTTGTITAYSVQLDSNDHPVEAGPESHRWKITGSELSGDTLILTGEDDEGISHRFSLQKRGENEVEFKVLGAPPPPGETDNHPGLKLTRDSD